MDEQFQKYLRTIGMGEVLQNRVEEILQIFATSFETEIKDIFVSEYVDSENKRVFENLWLLNSEFIMESKEFVSDYDFDFIRLKNNVVYLQIKKTSFDFKEPTNNSRLNLHLRFTDSLIGDFKASRENCTQLMYILKKYIQPNLSTT